MHKPDQTPSKTKTDEEKQDRKQQIADEREADDGRSHTENKEVASPNWNR